MQRGFKTRFSSRVSCELPLSLPELLNSKFLQEISFPASLLQSSFFLLANLLLEPKLVLVSKLLLGGHFIVTFVDLFPLLPSLMSREIVPASIRKPAMCIQRLKKLRMDIHWHEFQMMSLADSGAFHVHWLTKQRHKISSQSMLLVLAASNYHRST